MEQLESAHIKRPIRLTYPIQMASFPLPQLRALRGTPHQTVSQTTPTPELPFWGPDTDTRRL